MADVNLAVLAQDGGGAGGLLFSLVWIAIVVAVIVGGWKMFAKAGKPGWAFIVPIYNLIVLLEITGRPIWWVVLYLIPVVNLIVAIIVTIDLAKSFGKDVIFALGLIFLGFIFVPILGFGDAEYQGPAVAA